MTLRDFPLRVLGLSFVGLMLAAKIGVMLRIRVRTLSDEDRDDFRIALGATLTMLGLLIGFTFSMGASRYDLRQMYEEAEANAIGTPNTCGLTCFPARTPPRFATSSGNTSSSELPSTPHAIRKNSPRSTRIRRTCRTVCGRPSVQRRPSRRPSSHSRFPE